MEKYSKILIYIFLLCVTNIIASLFILFKGGTINNQANKPNPTATSISTSRPSPSPAVAKATESTDIKSDLNLIKAELRALRDAIENTAITTTTPKP